MTRIILDRHLRTQLRNLSVPLELCDETGQVLAQLTPIIKAPEYDSWEPPISEEELRDREQSEQWFTTEQVVAHLRRTCR